MQKEKGQKLLLCKPELPIFRSQVPCGTLVKSSHRPTFLLICFAVDW